MRVSLLLIFLLLNCSLAFAKKKTPERILYANQITREFIREMEQKYDCECIGSGGVMPKQVEDIRVEFALYHRATIEEARALEVLAVERLTEMVNADENIRPHLLEFPFPSYRAEVAFSFCAPYGGQFADGNLNYVFQTRGNLCFYAEDAEFGRSIALLKEPYSEAKKIVESSPIPNPFGHQEKPHEPLIDAVFCAYLREMAKEHDLECERIGGKLTEGVDEVVVRLIYFHPAKIDKARELQVVATEKLLAAINNNEQLRPYIKNYPLSLDKLKVDILLRKSNYFPYFDGVLDTVSREGDKVSYVLDYRYDGKKRCEVIAEELPSESYQECLKKVQSSSRAKKLKIKSQLHK